MYSSVIDTIFPQDSGLPPNIFDKSTPVNRTNARRNGVCESHDIPCSSSEESSEIVLTQGCTTYLYQGPQRIIISALEGRRQNYELNFRESSIKIPIF